MLSYGERMARLRAKQEAPAIRVKAPKSEEDRVFYDRLRFDQHQFWNWNRQPMERSMMGCSLDWTKEW